jgi:hypothetical protein
MLEVTVSGSAKLKSVAAQIRAAGDKGLGREMSTGLQRAARPIKAAVTAEYEGLPKGGGYAAEFTKSMAWRTTVRGAARTASFRLLLFGEGDSQRRDIEALESGRLRHPVYGRSRRIRSGPRAGSRDPNPWATTKIRGGYFKRGTNRAADDAEKEMGKVLDDFAKRLAG